MLEFGLTMDSHSLEIKRDGKFLGFIHWHPEKEPRIVLHPALSSLTLTEMQACIDRLRKETR